MSTTRKATKTTKAKSTLPAVTKNLTVKAAPKKVELPPLRRNMIPGTVLILLTGLYKGRRVIFLKQMESGLLLVTGVVGINGVPAKLVDQSYVIVTPTVLPLPESVFDLAQAQFDQEFFDNAKKFTQQQHCSLASGKIDKIGRNEQRNRLQKKLDDMIKPALVDMGKEYVSYISSKMSFGATGAK